MVIGQCPQHCRGNLPKEFNTTVQPIFTCFFFLSTTLIKCWANFSVKIIIKGDRNVGKSCLFHRLQGQKFIEEYIPTEEIRVASIQWNYKATDDVVKVEVWDVVDRGRRRRKLDGLKMENKNVAVESRDIIASMDNPPALDAEFLDVYKGTNGVIIMMDITKNWTFDYVQRELVKIPSHIPVIVLGNHCDMAHHRSVTSDHVTYFIDSLLRDTERRAQIRYAETSMRNGFGLKLLHKFFNLPFLQLQRETLLKQLETNEDETRLTVQELDLFQESDDADYDKFIDNLVNRRRAIADSVSSSYINTPTTPGPGGGTLLLPNVTSTLSSNRLQHNNDHVRRSVSMPGPIGGGTPIPGSNINNVVNESNKSVAINAGFSNRNSNNNSKQTFGNVDSVIPIASVDSSDGGPSSNRPQSFMSKIFGNKREDVESNSNSYSVGPLTSVEDFIPDDGMLDRSFLDDNSQPSPLRMQNQAQRDSDR